MNMPVNTSELESKPIVVSEDSDALVVEFLSKSYTDEDIFHIVDNVTPAKLEQIKELYCTEIIRGMRDYYLLRQQSDDKMNYLESLVLDKLEGAIALEGDANKILNMFKVLNSAKRRSEGEGQSNSTTTIHANKVVQLEMPARMLKQVAAPSFETNSNNEVIRVGSTDMATATNTQVLKQLNARTITDASKPVDVDDI